MIPEHVDPTFVPATPLFTVPAIVQRCSQMSSNGASGSHKSSGSFSGSISPRIAQSVSDVRTSIDSERGSTSSPVHSNGVPSNRNSQTNGKNDGSDSESDPVAQLQLELDRTREEKDALATQYRNLLAKLTTMRTTLGNKLQQDAVRIPFYSITFSLISLPCLGRT